MKLYYRGPNNIVEVNVDDVSSIDPTTGEEVFGVQFAGRDEKIYYPATSIRTNFINGLEKGETRLNDLLSESDES